MSNENAVRWKIADQLQERAQSLKQYVDKLKGDEIVDLMDMNVKLHAILSDASERVDE